MNPVLNKFYKAYLDWIESGARDRTPFRRDIGLCSNLINYFEYEVSDRYKAKSEMIAHFEKLNLDRDYPFYSHNMRDKYLAEMEQRTCYLNEVRIQWVKDRVAEAELEG